MIFRPATPGFLVTLIATILLAVVSFSVPWLKSVYFLKASLSVQGINGSITLGTLGYCLDMNEQVTCSNATVGYQFDPNALLGNDTRFQIPQVAVKWITYALVLHIVALCLAAGSALFGLLAHVREISMSCFSTCISGFAASIALLAFIFDLVLFFVARARINAVPGGSAQIGSAIWLTLAAWVLLFFSGCFFGFGRCCLSRRPRGPKAPKREDSYGGGILGGKTSSDTRAEQLRLDAVKAEADRKARQKAGTQEIGLPAFPEYEAKPLNSSTHDLHDEDDEPYRDNGYRRGGSDYAASNHAGRGAGAAALAASGYVSPAQAASSGDRHYDQAAQATANTYPPTPQRTPAPSSHQQYPSQYATQAQYTADSQPYAASPSRQQQQQQQQQQQYLAPSSHNQYLSAGAYERPGHHTQQSSYHSALSHQASPSHYSQQQVNEPNVYASSGSFNTVTPPLSTSTGNPYSASTTPFTAAEAPYAPPGMYGGPPVSPSPPQQPVYDQYGVPLTASPPQRQHNFFQFEQPQAQIQQASYTPPQQQYASSPQPQIQQASYTPQQQYTSSPPPLQLDIAPQAANITNPAFPMPEGRRQNSVPAPRGPRSPTSPTSPGGWRTQMPTHQEASGNDYSGPDAPPGYDAGSTGGHVQAPWGEKR